MQLNDGATRWWILKPPRGSWGRDIKLVSAWDQIDVAGEYVQKKAPLAQRYIANPLLLCGFKMTLRVCVVTGRHRCVVGSC